VDSRCYLCCPDGHLLRHFQVPNQNGPEEIQGRRKAPAREMSSLILMPHLCWLLQKRRPLLDCCVSLRVCDPRLVFHRCFYLVQ
jgi:hypothetical protein